VAKKKETVVVLSAHSDDFVLGAGGTIAQYAREGKKIFCVVFSYGEMSHPWLKRKVIQDVRAKEAYRASKVLGCTTSFFDLSEGQFLEEYAHHKKELNLGQVIERLKPSKIFTHSEEDPHPDHRAVHKITLEMYDALTLKRKPEVYAYSIWNPVSFKTSYPSLYVDITETFSRKLQAIKEYPSQKVHIAVLTYFLVPARAIKDGFRIRKPWGEHFLRIR
jgi:LmbE family N-acetylglucosaminyl deacetylase